MKKKTLSRAEICTLYTGIETDKHNEHMRHKAALNELESRRIKMVALCAHPNYENPVDCCYRCPDCGDNWY